MVFCIYTKRFQVFASLQIIITNKNTFRNKGTKPKVLPNRNTGNTKMLSNESEIISQHLYFFKIEDVKTGMLTIQTMLMSLYIIKRT